ncbi:MAG: putative LytR family regulatory protein [Friedmanniella sp.]|nr:putative LytR family regulatory protein [Friedmanniella sp.]
MSVFFREPASGVGDAPPPPVAASRSRWRWLRRSLVVVVALVVVVLTAVGLYAGTVSSSFTDNVHRSDLMPTPAAAPSGTAASPARPAKAANDAVNYVLMGSDSRDKGDAEAGRSDSLMVLHLAADRRSAYLISFPRDMWVPIPGHGLNKINAAFSFGGPPLAVATLERLLGTRMDHVALLDFEGMIGLTEDLGGITVVNKHASSSRGYDFPAGPLNLRGDRALAYVRERYDLPRGDLDRAERQRQVVQAILAKGLSPSVVTSPGQFTGFVAGLARYLTVDSALSDDEIRRTALSLRLTASDLVMLQAPLAGFATIKGQSVDVVDQARLRELAAALHEDAMADYLVR